MTRWTLVVALLVDPVGMTQCLARLLEAWPAERHRYLLADDCRRRRARTV